MFSCLKFAERVRTPVLRYRNIFDTGLPLRMKGSNAQDIVRLRLEETIDPQPEDYYAYLELGRSRLPFVFQTEEQLKVCSTDFFRHSVATGEGRLIRVRVTECEEVNL